MEDERLHQLKTTIRNGAPYLVNHDFTLGDRLAFQQGNLLYVDQCYGIKLTYDRSTFPRLPSCRSARAPRRKTR